MFSQFQVDRRTTCEAATSRAKRVMLIRHWGFIPYLISSIEDRPTNIGAMQSLGQHTRGRFLTLDLFYRFRSILFYPRQSGGHGRWGWGWGCRLAWACTRFHRFECVHVDSFGLGEMMTIQISSLMVLEPNNHSWQGGKVEISWDVTKTKLEVARLWNLYHGSRTSWTLNIRVAVTCILGLYSTAYALTRSRGELGQ